MVAASSITRPSKDNLRAKAGEYDLLNKYLSDLSSLP